VALAALAFAPPLLAQSGRKIAAAEAIETERESPWLVAPIFSLDPKLGTSLGAMAGYMHHFDEKSRLSIFGVNVQYTSTGSTVAGAFGRASWAEDRHRLTALAVGGRVRNDYDDYLGTGVPLHSSNELSALAGRYLQRVTGDWFLGVQGINTNYSILGETALDEQVLNVLGIKSFTSTGVGLAAYHDSRDSDTMPTRGWVLNLNNIAYRASLGGSEDYDVYRLDYKSYWAHGAGHVLALRQNNQWTADAPPAAQSSVQLRGYKMGQFLGKDMSSVEAEERYRWSEKWTSTFFAGIACLYGDGKSCSDRENAFPNVGAGVQYVIKRKEGIVLNLEYATGKAGNYGLYLKMGYSF